MSGVSSYMGTNPITRAPLMVLSKSLKALSPNTSHCGSGLQHTNFERTQLGEAGKVLGPSFVHSDPRARRQCSSVMALVSSL